MSPLLEKTEAVAANLETHIENGEASTIPPKDASSIHGAQGVTSAKRKRVSFVESDLNEEQVESPTAVPPPTKRPRPDETTYNLERSVELCVKATINSRIAHGQPPLSPAKVELLSNGLPDLYTNVLSGITYEKIIKDSGLRRVLALNAIAEQKHEQHIAALFVAHHTSISVELTILNEFVDSHKRITIHDIRIVKDSIIRVHETLVKNTMWHNTMSSLNLPLDGLRAIGKWIKELDNTYLAHLEFRVNDIERRLTPVALTTSKVHDGSPADPFEVLLKDKEVLQQKNDSLQKEKDDLQTKIVHVEARHRTDLAAKNSEHDQTLLEIKQSHEAKEKQLNSTEQALRVRLAAKEQEVHAADNRRRQEIATLQFRQEQESKGREFRHQEELRAAFEKGTTSERDRSVAETNKVRKEEDEALQVSQDAGQQRREAGEKNQDQLRSLLAQHHDGTLTETTVNSLMSKVDCLDKLTSIWAAMGNRLADLFPHDLILDPNLSLEIEVDTILVARICLVILQIRTCAPEEIIKTGWNLTTMNRLKAGLVLYVEGKPLSTLRINVNHICDMLQEVLVCSQPPLVPKIEVQPPTPFTTSFGSSTSTQATSVFDQTPVDSFESSTTTGNQSTFSNATTSNPATAFQQANNNGNTTMAQPLGLGRISPFAASVPSKADMDTPMLDAVETKKNFRSKEVCHHLAFKKSCKYGDRCKFNHDLDDILRARLRQKAETQLKAQQPATTGFNSAVNGHQAFGTADNNKRYHDRADTARSIASLPDYDEEEWMPQNQTLGAPLLQAQDSYGPQSTFPPAQASISARHQLAPLEQCKNEQKYGNCRNNGKGCKRIHLHPEPSPNQNPPMFDENLVPILPLTEPHVRQQKKQCRYEERYGDCRKNGKGCPFAHQLPPANASQQQPNTFQTSGRDRSRSLAISAPGYPPISNAFLPPNHNASIHHLNPASNHSSRANTPHRTSGFDATNLADEYALHQSIDDLVAQAQQQYKAVQQNVNAQGGRWGKDNFSNENVFQKQLNRYEEDDVDEDDNDENDLEGLRVHESIELLGPVQGRRGGGGRSRSRRSRSKSGFTENML